MKSWEKTKDLKFLQLKKIVSISLILIMLLSLCTPIMSLAVDEPKVQEDNESEYCKFDINWFDETNVTKKINVKSNESVKANYKLELNTVSTGFENLTMRVSDISESNARLPVTISITDPNNSNVNQISGNTLIFKDVVNAGNSLSSDIVFNFPRTEDFSNYEKSISVVLTGRYKDPITEEYVYINIEKKLEVTVEPKEEVYNYTVDMTMADSSIIMANRREIYGNSTTEEYKYLGWKTEGVKARYKINLYSMQYTQKATLNITINRTSDKNSNPMAGEYTVNWGELTKVLGEPETIPNEDGSVTYKFSKGNNSNSFDGSDCFTMYEKQYDISVFYKIPAEETTPQKALSEDSSVTQIYLSANFEGTGWNVTSSKEGITSETVTINKSIYKAGNMQVLQYTPGYHAWASVSYLTSEDEKSLKSEMLNSLARGENIDLGYRVLVNYINGTVDERTGNVSHEGTEIRYFGDDKQVKTIQSNDAMILKSVSVVNGMSLIENGQEHELSGETYTIENGKNITSYTIKLNDFLRNRPSGYEVTYTLSGSKLKELGLSETEIKNIISVGQKSSTRGEYFGGGNESNYYASDAEAYKKSYMELDIGNSDGNVNEYGEKQDNTISLVMYKNTNVIQDNNITVKNVNPTIYVKYPDSYKYTVEDVTLSDNANGKIWIKSFKMENGYLIIECEGTYTDDMGTVTIQVKGARKLIDANPNELQKVEAYLFTDNENYVEPRNVYVNPEKIRAHYMTQNFTVEKSSGVSVKTGIYKNGILYVPNGNSESSKQNPMKYNNNEVVTYRVVVNSNGETLENVSIINRLPIEGNSSISTTTPLPLGSTISLINLENIKVYVNDTIQTSNYTIYYSENINAVADSDFTELTDDVNLNNVKTIKVVMNDGFKLNGNKNLVVEYQMTMPAVDNIEDNIAGSISKLLYGTNENLESSAVYVSNGDSKGTIKLKKTFEGIENGAPEGVSLQGIKFRFINVNTDSVLTINGENIFETDVNGELTINNVPEGTYRVKEESTFKGYKGINYKEVTIENGKAYPKTIEAENKLELGTLKVTKIWQDALEAQGSVTLKVEGKDFSATATVTKQNAVATFSGLPYGNYKITETTGIYGWHGEDVDVTLNEETVECDFENYITTGDLEIIKTVPQGETVEGLTFNVSGEGDIKYINKNGQEVKNTINETIVVEQNKENIEISENKEQVKITVKNLPVGVYVVKEINMPQIDTEEGKVTKYVDINRSVTIHDKQGETTNLTLENRYKTGNISVTVTATEGANLEEFKVKLSGTSYYNTKYEDEIKVPENGKIEFRGLEIGKYKVEECNTKVENGKIVTTNPEGFEVTYDPENANTTGVEVKYSKTSNVKIHNEYNGTGKVKIVKTLEDEDDKSKAKGIQFKIKGKDLVGRDVDETITIGEDGTGTSNNIPVGTYLLSEVEETVPKIYQIAEEQEITIKSSNEPLVLNIENKLAIGKIVMETELATGGYPPSPVTYKVTKVDNDLNSIEAPIEIRGDRKSYAELNDLKAGKYLVEQEIIPKGYIKDTRQVVNITRDESGYALFIIEKEEIEEFENTKVTINKKIVNSNGNTATAEDFTKAKINQNDKHSFEVKIQNVESKEVYYSFIDEQNSDTIVGLPYGTYEIEEVYKPKYKMIEMSGERLETNEETGKSTFTLSEDNENIENNIIIDITNQIDTDFGFGGQDFKDNLSKEIIEKENQLVTTKAKIYVRDDENNKISDATFKLYDSNGNIIKLSGVNGIYVQSDEGSEVITPIDGTIVLRALPVGEYKLVNVGVGVDSNLLKSDDRTVTVYKDAVGITRIELLKNIARGYLRISTVYTDEGGNEHFAPRSKYKVLNPETLEVLTFIRKADGTYERSNLPNAKEEITVKAGYVDVKGIEAGITYQVGIVDLTNTYGIIKEAPEEITVVEGNENYQEVKVNVKNRTGMFTKVINPGSGTLTVALDQAGKIWMYDDDGYGAIGIKYNKELQCISDLSKYEAIKDVQFKDIDAFYQFGSLIVVAVDMDGKIWTWSNNNTGLLGYNYTNSMKPTCISTLCDQNVKIEKVVFDMRSSSPNGVFALDTNGKIWFWGSYRQQEYGKNWLNYTTTPICMSDLCDLKNVIVKDIIGDGYNTMIAIDSNGDAWTWGWNNEGSCGVGDPYIGSYIKPTCITKIEGSNIENVKMKSGATGLYTSFLIDTENRLWVFGSNNYGLRGNGEEDSSSWNPVCLNYNNPNNPLNGIGINYVSCEDETVAVIDENGKLWTWGNDSYDGLLGTGSEWSDYLYYPKCISDLQNNELSNVKLEQVSMSSGYNCSAIDSEGNIWMWGEALAAGFRYSNEFKYVPTKITVSKTAHLALPNFKKISAGADHSVAIDENGKVWSWGYNEANSNQLGIGQLNSNIEIRDPQLVGGFNNKIGKETIIDIDAGYRYTLAVDSEGKLWTWGYVNYTALGVIGYTDYTGNPICITNINTEENLLYGKKIVKAKAGYHINGAIDKDGKLYICSGNEIMATTDSYICMNEIYEELKNKKIIDVEFSNYVSDNHIIILDEDGKVWTLGYNRNGELGYAGTTYSKNPVCISNMEGNTLYGKVITNIAAGSNHSAAIDSEGNLYVWGSNSNGEFGNGTKTSSYMPICLTKDKNCLLYGKKVKKVELGDRSTLVVDSEGRIYTCGYNYRHVLGQENTNSYLSMKCINNSINFIPEVISMGSQYNVLAIDVKGNVWVWGNCANYKNGNFSNDLSEPTNWLGNKEIYDTTVQSLNELKVNENVQNILVKGEDTPDNITYPENIKEKQTVKDKCTIALDNEGYLWTWAEKGYTGNMIDGPCVYKEEPTRMEKFSEAKIDKILYVGRINSTGSNSYNVPQYFVKDEDGNIWSWGDNSGGQLGTEERNGYILPVCISKGNDLEGKNITTIIPFVGVVVAIDENGKVYTWGNNGDYLGHDTDVTTPKCISNGTDMENAKIEKVINVGMGQFYAMTADGETYTWGSNVYYAGGTGIKATGTTGKIKSPIKFGKGNTAIENLKVMDIYEDNSTYYLITTNVKLYSWGLNSQGACGIGTTTEVSNPINLSARYGFDVKEVLRYKDNVIILDTNGDVWTWGHSNRYGFLGTGNTSNVYTATCISKNKFNVDEIYIDENSNVVVVKDRNGKIWTWGYGSLCGQGTTSPCAIPKCISEGKFVTDKLIIAGSTAIVKDTNGKYWTWGNNYNGECGTGNGGYNVADVTEPTSISDGTDLEGKDIVSVQKIAAIMVATDSNGKVYTWGKNSNGECGQGTTSTYATPKCINTGELENVKFVEFSYNNSVITAKDSEGKTWKWGKIKIEGTEEITTSPICTTDYYNQIGLDYDNSRIIELSGFTAAIDSEGKVWTWGSNTAFACGVDGGQYIDTPTCISNETNGLNLKNGDITNAGSITYALANDGTAWAWGRAIKTPIKLNDLNKLQGKVIKEICFWGKPNALCVLTEEKEIYLVKFGAEITVEEAEFSEEATIIQGQGTRQFVVVKNGNYAN